MKFADALALLKAGHAIARESWGGRAVFKIRGSGSARIKIDGSNEWVLYCPSFEEMMASDWIDVEAPIGATVKPTLRFLEGNEE